MGKSTKRFVRLNSNKFMSVDKRKSGSMSLFFDCLGTGLHLEFHPPGPLNNYEGEIHLKDNYDFLRIIDIREDIFDGKIDNKSKNYIAEMTKYDPNHGEDVLVISCQPIFDDNYLTYSGKVTDLSLTSLLNDLPNMITAHIMEVKNLRKYFQTSPFIDHLIVDKTDGTRFYYNNYLKILIKIAENPIEQIESLPILKELIISPIKSALDHTDSLYNDGIIKRPNFEFNSRDIDLNGRFSKIKIRRF